MGGIDIKDEAFADLGGPGTVLDPACCFLVCLIG